MESWLRMRQKVLCQWLCVMLCILPAGLSAAEDKWRYCGPTPIGETTAASPLKNSEPVTTRKELVFTADQATVEDSIYHLEGDVQGGSGSQQISGESMRYDANTDKLEAHGNVRYAQSEVTLSGDKASFQLGEDKGEIAPARFWYPDRHLRGDAARIELLGPTETQLETARFTTCNEGSNDWWLKASSLHLDTAANEGVAKHARVHFMQVPIFYFPYLSFPLEGRKSGFLFPLIGQHDDNGTEIETPYYWNIAPDRDATLTPRYMSRRGTLMETEFRYLNPTNHGQLNLNYLPGDRLYNNDDRSTATFNHSGNPAPGWSTAVNFRYASDKDYMNDFGYDIDTTSLTHLEKTAQLAYQGNHWQASARVQAYQTLDESQPVSTRPYQRLPQLRLAMADQEIPGGFWMGADAEMVRFYREEGVTGQRYDLQPRISLPMRGAAGFLVPKLGYRYTAYNLEHVATGADSSPTRSMPFFSIDSGLVFERDLDYGGRAQQQTLEPRLYYLYVPYRDQADLIVGENGTSQVFDSSLATFSMSQLFRDNRFNGVDRVGDTRQLSAALTTRLLDDRGRELLSASLGRIYYFQDREVGLPGAAVQDDKVSDWAAELRSQWTPALSAKATALADPWTREIVSGSADFRYQKDRRNLLRFSYRYARDADVMRQSDVGVIFPLGERWFVMGRWLHAVEEDVMLESVRGVEYQSCCWSVRIMQRWRRGEVSDDLKQAIWVQLELKGLTSVGSQVENVISSDILAN